MLSHNWVTVLYSSRKEGPGGRRREDSFQLPWVTECGAGSLPWVCAGAASLRARPVAAWQGSRSTACRRSHTVFLRWWTFQGFLLGGVLLCICKEKEKVRRELRGLECFGKPQRKPTRFSLLGGFVFCRIYLLCLLIFSTKWYSRYEFLCACSKLFDSSGIAANFRYVEKEKDQYVTHNDEEGSGENTFAKYQAEDLGEGRGLGGFGFVLFLLL